MTAGRDPVEAKYVVKDGNVALAFDVPVAPEFAEEVKAMTNKPTGVATTYAARLGLMQLLNIKFEDFDS